MSEDDKPQVKEMINAIIQAQCELNLEDEQKRLNDQGIIHSIRNEKDLDEAAGAYKPIDEVMRNQADLVEIVTKLTPLAVIKG